MALIEAITFDLWKTPETFDPFGNEHNSTVMHK